MKVSYFYRKRRNNNYSIEELFKTITDNMANYLDFGNVYASRKSKGLINRLIIMVQFLLKQGDINHLTGDINFGALLLSRKKTILTIHDVRPLEEKKGLRKKLIWLFWFYFPSKKVRYITVVSEFTKTRLLDHLRIEPDRIRVIYNCVPFECEDVVNSINNGKPVLLQMGTADNKNLESLATAVKDIWCRLLIVGKLTDRQMEMLEDNRIEFENRYDLTRKEVYQCYSMSDIVCFVSKYEGFGMPIIEANAVGKPVITSNLGAMREIAGNAAMLVNPYDIRDIRRAILDLLNNEELRSRLIKNGYENVKKFKPEKVAAQYYELYRVVAKGGCSES